MKNKVVSIILSFCMLMGVVHYNSNPTTAFENAPTFTITHEKQEVKTIIVPQDSKKTLTVEPQDDDYTYQWQIVEDVQSNSWVDIYGQTNTSIDVSYTMVSLMLDAANGTYIRCVMTKNKQEMTTDPISVTIAPVPPFTTPTVDTITPLVQPPSKGLRVARAGEFVTITVNYLDAETKQPLYGSSINEIEAGTSFTQPIISPTFLGFAPYYNADDLTNSNPASATTDASRIILNQSIDNDIVINVYYKPVNVPYAARYFFQGILDDLYTENEALYRKSSALTGTIIDTNDLTLPEEKTIGFTALYHYPESVAADGSTVFECYYDRNYYLLKFDCFGGYGVEPIYARYETPVVIGTPIRPGYQFSGWDELKDSNGDGVKEYDGVPDTLPSMVPASNKTYRALWGEKQTKVTYVYWRENANDNGFSYWGSYQDMISSNIPSLSYTDAKTAKDANLVDADYFTLDVDNEKNDEGVAIRNDNTIVNVYYKRKVYSLRFYIAMKTVSGNNENYYVLSASGNPTINYQNSMTTKITNNELAKQFVFGSDVHTETIGSNTYFYLELTGKYLQEIAFDWPSTGPYLGNPTTPPRNNSIGNLQFVNWYAEGNSVYADSNKKTFMQGPTFLLNSDLINDANQDIGSNIIMNVDKKEHTLITAEYLFQNFDEITYEKRYEFRYPIEKGQGTQAAFKFEGFTEPSNSTGNPIQFSYYRLKYPIIAENSGEVVLKEERFFEASLDDFVDYQKWWDSKKINYPDNLEPKMYVFKGFYTTPDCIPGTEVVEGMTMPAHEMRLYTKWEPITHDVHFFNTYEDLKKFEDTSDETYRLDLQQIPHGYYIDTIQQPSNNNLTFVGWFYMKDGVKTAYIPSDIPIMRDMKIYADWSSENAQPFQIQYVLRNTDTKVADDTLGYAFEGSTRSFLPKVGEPFNQLYSGYNEGYFPLIGSHSMIMREVTETNENPNYFKFEYVQLNDPINYTVKYINRDTGKPMIENHEGDIKETKNAVVTERFKVFPNYVPDAFYKRLIVSVQDDGKGGFVGTAENVITFYYTSNDTSAHYAVHHMMQKVGDAYKDGTNYALDGTGDYVENVKMTEGVADKDKEFNYTPIQINGYHLDTNKDAIQVITNEDNSKTLTNKPLENNQYSIDIKANGTDLYVFYKLNEYSYTIKCYDFNKRNDPIEENRRLHIKDEISGELKAVEDIVVEGQQYSSFVTVNAPNYSKYGYNASFSNFTLKIVNNIDVYPNPNEIIFYYIPNEYHVTYRVINEEGGSLSNDSETIQPGENSKGSIPTADFNYSFIGWYKDPEGKVPVSSSDGTIDENGKFIPNVNALKAYPEENIFYAKFMEPSGALTIIRSDAVDEGNGEQVFVYEITSADDSTFKMTISLEGDGSKTIIGLPKGEYTITQLNNWSWRYEDIAQTISLDPSKDVRVTFSKGTSNNKWLSGNSNLVSNRGGKNNETQ